MTNRRHGEAGSATIAIIGGGFSGCILAAQLLRNGHEGVSVVVIDRGFLPGRGVAYGTRFDGHLLNVRAGNMSAYPDAPAHFLKWAQSNYSPSVRAEDFLPRTVYGRYAGAQLREASSAHPGKLRWIQDEAVSLTRAGSVTKLHLASGQMVIAGKVVLALGNFPPGDLKLPGKDANSSRFVSNPWSKEASVVTGPENSVLLIGSGLTSVDKVLELRTRGFDGTIHILSRRGLLPQSHQKTTPIAAFWSVDSPRTVRGLLRLIRSHIEVAEAQGSDWRAVIDSLRPVTQRIWQGLSSVERRRFLRHLRTYWDVHRHRIAEQIAEQLAPQLSNGHIQVHAGRIAHYKEDAKSVAITYRDRNNGAHVTLRVDRVINCTGPEADYRRVGSPLLLDLMAKKLARPDELSLGLEVSNDGAVLDSSGMPSDFLYAIGPLRKGNLWETIAVPEIRVQAAELAKLIIASHQPQDSALRTLANAAEISATL